MKQRNLYYLIGRTGINHGTRYWAEAEVHAWMAEKPGRRAFRLEAAEVALDMSKVPASQASGAPAEADSEGESNACGQDEE